MQKEKYVTTLTLGCDLLGQPEKSGKFLSLTSGKNNSMDNGYQYSLWISTMLLIIMNLLMSPS